MNWLLFSLNLNADGTGHQVAGHWKQKQWFGAFTLHSHSIQISLEWMGENSHLLGSLWNKKELMCVQCSSFSKGYLRDCLLTCLSHSTDETWHTLNSLQPVKTKQSWTVYYCSTGLTVQQQGLIEAQQTISAASFSMEKEKSKVCIQHLGFGDSCPRDFSVSPFLELWWNTAYSTSSGALRRKESWDIQHSFRELATLQRHQKEQQIMSSWQKEWQIPLIWN